jgi:hypothetical protein
VPPAEAGGYDSLYLALADLRGEAGRFGVASQNLGRIEQHDFAGGEQIGSRPTAQLEAAAQARLLLAGAMC